jgi:TolB protein
MYGHMPLLGIKRLVEPFFSGERPYWEDYPPNYSTAKRVQEMGGVVSYAHPSNQLGVLLGPHQAREFPIDLALGVVNALDVLSNADEAATSHLYYRVLNAGLRCTASAGTDTQMDVPDNSSIPGGGRVYVKVDPPLTYAKWIEGYRAGRTFVSNGPMLFLNVDGKGPGDEIRLTGPRRITVSAEARSIPPMKALELIVNGEVAATATPTAEGTAAKLSHTLQADESAWVAARVTGPAHRRVMNDSQLFAHTSPVYLVRDGKPVAIAKDAAIVLGWIDRLIEDVKKSPRFAKDAHRQEVLEIFQRGRRHYEKIASAK